MLSAVGQRWLVRDFLVLALDFNFYEGSLTACCHQEVNGQQASKDM